LDRQIILLLLLLPR